MAYEYFSKKPNFSKGKWQKIGGKSVVGIYGQNKAGDKEVYQFSIRLDENTILNLTVYPDSTFSIGKGYNAGKSGMLGWCSLSKKVRG